MASAAEIPHDTYIPTVDPLDFHYELPAERIAAHPLAERDRSRLLVCAAQSATIQHTLFANVAGFIPDDALLVVNVTRVVRARIVLARPTGGRVEIFLLEPAGHGDGAGLDPAVALAAHGEGRWVCLVGGARKFERAGELVVEYPVDGAEPLRLRATLHERRADGFVVAFTWSPTHISFAEVLERAGQVPLPPYIDRQADQGDVEGYQTVYARQDGAVAAPTAGLHFTPTVLETLRAKGVARAELTLHVGAGTFRPFKGDVREHAMHEERVEVSAATLAVLLQQAERREQGPGAPFVVVGTTSLRTLESLYWFGVRLALGEARDAQELRVDQWDPYRLSAINTNLPTVRHALNAVAEWLGGIGASAVRGRTGIMIVPGYQPRMCDALLTNFHQPESTLLLLVGALLGRDLWRRVYAEALAGGYRFLSYGDSSLLVLNEQRMRWG